MGKFWQFSLLVLLFLLAACASKDTHLSDNKAEKDAIVNLLCGSEPEASCFSRICKNESKCAIVQALSNEAIFDFVSEYAGCEGCETPDFPPERGIGKCIEYRADENSVGVIITFWVSENCAFRYSNPTESQIRVELHPQTFEIENISPAAAYLVDPLYCQVDNDCLLLSGSGIPVIGCSNYFYAPLNRSGYYPDQHCNCIANRCSKK